MIEDSFQLGVNINIMVDLSDDLLGYLNKKTYDLENL